MKRTYRKTVVRTIRQSLSRFLAIFAIVALGVGFLAGLLATTPDMRYSADRFFDETDLFDLRIVGTLGLTDEDVKAVRAIDGVEQVMPAYSADAIVNTPSGDGLVARIQSVPLDQIEEKEPQGYLNRMEVVEGRLPVKEDECVVEEGSDYHAMGFSVGDTLTISPDNEDWEDTFTRKELKVVGVVSTSDYFSIERESASVGDGTVDVVLYTGEQNFALDVWTDIYVQVEGAKAYDSLTDAYTDYVDLTAQKIEDISGERSRIRYEQVKTEAEEALADATAEYEDAKAEAEQKLADAEEELEDGRSEIEENEKKLASAQKEIEDGQAELDANKESLPGTLTAQQQQLADAQAKLIDAKAEYEAGVAQVEQKSQELADAKQQLEQAKQLVELLEPTLTKAQEALPELQARVDELQPTVDSAKQLADQLEAARAEAETKRDEASANLDAANTELTNAQAAIDAARGELTEEEWAAQKPEEAAPLLAARTEAEARVQTAQTELDTAQQALDLAASQAETARAQADAAQALLDEANSALAEGQQTLNDTQAQLDEAKAQIAENEPKITEGEKQLEDAKAQLEEAKKQITEGEKQIAKGESALSMAPGLAQLELELAQEKLDSARTELEDGTAQLEDAKQQLSEGEAEYAEQKKSAEEQLADAKQQLDDAQKEIDELEEPEWYLLTRDENVSFASLKSNVQKVEAIARVFPVFFFLVAALVALTTMTRMVEEERLQIGTMKALGYSKKSIMAKYVIYAMTATVAGCVFGLLVGFNLFPTVIWNAYSMMYTLPKIYCLFNFPYAAIASGAAILCTLAATLNACWATLMETPATLMLPKAPKAGKRILLERVRPVWKRMKFTHKVTARNLFRYKKRFFMTVVGIAGCTALLVTGFGLHDSISDIVNKQFGKVFTYDFTVSVRDPEEFEGSELEEVLGDSSLVTDWTLVHQEQSENEFGDITFETYLFVPQESSRIGSFVDLHERVSGDAVPFSETGVVITEKMSERANLSVGDTVNLENKDGRTGTFRVDGIVENYVENYVYMSAETYESGFGEAPEFDLVLGHAADDSADGRAALNSVLLKTEGVAGVNQISDLKNTFSGMMQKIDIIVVVLIVSAGVLAFVVLYNLTNINITERTKEIATIKVLGFYDSEVSAYVYRESVALSIIGTLAGLVLGIFLHMFVIHSVEVDAVMFGRTIKPLSYVFSALLTLLFSALVNLVMHRKLRHISMVESMKAPE